MTRIISIVVSLALVFVLAFTRSAVGQARLLAQPPGARADAQKPPADEKKKVPNWEGMHGVDNCSYLRNIQGIRDEMERLRGDRDWTDALGQLLGTAYSYVGRYQKALEFFDRKAGPEKPGQLIATERYEPVDAVAAILEVADKHQVIMINEAHHVPMHRAFTLQLLEGLYRKGFRYFAAEALHSADKDLQSRGYPTIGGYVSEPVFGDLVRTALKLGFNVIPYECEESTMPDKVDPVPAMNFREQGQARNLKERILDKDPSAKIIVHAGYAHIYKRLDGRRKNEVKWMALAFQELTGIEPFSIDQTEMSEINMPANEKPDYRFATEKGLVKDRPVVLRDKEKGGYFVGAANGLMYDLSVIHPRSRYENGRPTWLEMGGRRTPYTVKTDALPSEGKSYLAQAFYAEEEEPRAVPIDQMACDRDEPLPTLWLPTSGKFRIRIVDDKAAVVEEQGIFSR